MPFLGVPPKDLDLLWEKEGVSVSCVHSSAGVSTSILVQDGLDSVVLDVGDGALRDLIGRLGPLVPGTFDDRARVAMGKAVEGVRFIALSHDHFDHSGGLLSVLGFLGMVGRRSPLKVLAPEGSEVARSIVRTFEGMGLGGFDVELVDLKDEGSLHLSGWEIEWIQADHCDISLDGRVGKRVPSVCITLRRRGVAIFYTGDTAFHERLERLASGCDLAIAEGTYPAGSGRPAHMSVGEATRLVRSAGAGWVVHLTGASKTALDGGTPRK